MLAADLESAETRFERLRGRVGLITAPLALLVLWNLPLALDPRAHRLAAILAAVVVLWITEAIPMAMTALLGVAAAVVTRVAPAQEAFAPFADPLIFLFIGTFMLARAIFFHGLDRRFAFAILSLRAIGESRVRVLAAYSGVTCVLSMWISNTATVAMMFPIGVSILSVLERARASRLDAADSGSMSGIASSGGGFSAALLLSTSFAASIGGLATPVGTPPNLIGIGFIRRETGADVTFFQWMALALPITVLLFFVMVAMLRREATRDGGASVRGVAEMVRRERSALGPWTRGQINTLIAFGVTVSLWIVPGIFALVLGATHPLARDLASTLSEGAVALLGAGLLFVLPTNLERHEFTLPWEEAVQIDWWIVFLYGGGMALGTMVFKTGLAEAMGRGLTGWLGVNGPFSLLAVSTLIATILSETTSNTASANMVVPVVIALARSAGMDAVLPALGATMGSSLGFMLPVSTPCNAIVYGSGRIPLGTMIRNGVLLDVGGVVVIVAVLWLLEPLLGG